MLLFIDTISLAKGLRVCLVDNAIDSRLESDKESMMFDKELKFFIDHQDELVAKHSGKTLVIRGENIEGVFETPLEAYLSAEKQFPVGTFMIQPCQPGPSAYTVTISSMNW